MKIVLENLPIDGGVCELRGGGFVVSARTLNCSFLKERRIYKKRIGPFSCK